MITYKCITECTWNGRRWREGDITSPYGDDVAVPEHFIIGTDDNENTEYEEDTEDTTEDEIKRGFRGSWKLPNGDVFTGKREEARIHWNKIKNN
jgi:hypothetical protein